MSEPVSGSPYIIICNGRIGVAATLVQDQQIVVSSQTAANLVSFMQSFYKHFNPVDALGISTIQHQLMDHLTGVVPLTPEQVHTKIQALFDEMDALEDKY